MRQPENEILTLLDKNVCILDTDAIEYPTRALYTNINLINIYTTIDLIINKTSNHHHNHNITIDEMISDMKINDDDSYRLLLNLQSTFLTASIEKSTLSMRKINNASVHVYTTSLDYHISNRKMTSFKHTNYSAHHFWILEDARCLKKLGAYLIILVGDFKYEVAEALMSRMHEYVDVIIGVNDDNDDDNDDNGDDDDNEDNEDESKFYYLHNHYEIIMYDNNTIMSPSSTNRVDFKGRILLFDKSRLRSHNQDDQHHNNQELKHYGNVHIKKTSNYQLMINRTV